MAAIVASSTAPIVYPYVTKSCAIAEDHSAHTWPSAAKYSGRYGWTSAGWSGSANPMIVARNIAIVSFPSVSVSQVSRLAVSVGIAARHPAACRSPASVASQRQLGVDRLLAAHAPADQAPQQRPAQVRVDREPVEHGRAVEQPGEELQVLRRGRPPRRTRERRRAGGRSRRAPPRAATAATRR